MNLLENKIMGVNTNRTSYHEAIYEYANHMVNICSHYDMAEILLTRCSGNI